MTVMRTSGPLGPGRLLLGSEVARMSREEIADAIDLGCTINVYDFRTFEAATHRGIEKMFHEAYKDLPERLFRAK
jgi:hypothetical protein